MAIQIRDRLAPPPELRGKPYQFHGQNADFIACDAPQVILSGPAETGKTLAALYKLNQLAWDYPGLKAALVRKTYKAMPGSVLETFEKKILAYPPSDPRCLVNGYGGKKPERYIYPNGSVIWLGGMDDPSRVLSSERDIIYVNQAEELAINDWETLSTRTTGRAGVLKPAQLLGDCNPGARSHWIKQAADEGRLALYESRHRDNPVLYDQATGALTEQGRRTMEALDALTGVRKERLRYGRWASAEGVVYDTYDPAVHLIDRFDIPSSWTRVRGIDFGYTNPFSCSWYAIDPDGRMYRYRQIYMTGRLVEDHARQIVALSQGEHIAYTVADHDAEGIATLTKYGVRTTPANKAIKEGVEDVQARLRVAGDGKPRLFFLRDSLVERDASLPKGTPCCTEEEMEAYSWPQGADGKPNKEVPVDQHNHGLDELRYVVRSLSAPRTRFGVRK